MVRMEDMHVQKMGHLLSVLLPPWKGCISHINCFAQNSSSLEVDRGGASARGVGIVDDGGAPHGVDASGGKGSPHVDGGGSLSGVTDEVRPRVGECPEGG